MFELKIELGNDAMQTPDDVATVLTQISKRLQGLSTDSGPCAHGFIHDQNGNKVGDWYLELPESPEED